MNGSFPSENAFSSGATILGGEGRLWVHSLRFPVSPLLADDWPRARELHRYCPPPPNKGGAGSEEDHECPHFVGRGGRIDSGLGEARPRPAATKTCAPSRGVRFRGTVALGDGWAAEPGSWSPGRTGASSQSPGPVIRAPSPLSGAAH